MKILVTGGAGFIGSAIVSKALSRGHEAVVLDNLSTGYTENLGDLNVDFVKGDVLDRQLVRDVAAKAEVIFHLAASVGNIRSMENPYADVEANYVGTLNVLEAARENGIDQVIYSSTAAGYGEPKYLPIDEDHPFNPDSPYGVTKIAAEKLALSYGRNYGIKVACLRYFNAYGVNQRYDAYGNVIPIFAQRLARKLPIVIYGDGSQSRDFVNVNDIARANILALEQKVTGYYNIATGKKTTINELVETFERVSGITPDIEYAPPRKGEVIHSVASIDKAEKAINYLPEVSLNEGLGEYWEWYLCNVKHD